MSQNPNMVTIFSPGGEAFEVSKLNGRDLTNHGWTYNRVVAAATPAPPPPPVEPATVAADPAPVTPPAPEPEIVAEAPAKAALRLIVEDFADLETKGDVAAYIDEAFPGTKIDGRANRDKLIALAIELANAPNGATE